jgi:hypothetical protein
MSKISFGDVENAASTETAVAVIEPKAPAIIPAQSIADESKGLVGEWTSRDIRHPYLSIVGRNSEVADTIPAGTLVIEKSNPVNKVEGKVSTPVTAIALNMLKTYQENIPYDDVMAGATRRTFNSAAEVSAAGGRVSWYKGAGNFGEVAHIEFLIRVDADYPLAEETDAFFHLQDSEGRRYAHVLYTAASTAYSVVAIPLVSAVKNHLKETGLKGGLWHLSTQVKTSEKTSWWGPVLKAAGKVDEATAELIGSL